MAGTSARLVLLAVLRGKLGFYTTETSVETVLALKDAFISPQRDARSHSDVPLPSANYSNAVWPDEEPQNETK